MEQSIVFPGRTPPSWQAVQEKLRPHSVQVQMRMIDNELAFPDEKPPEDWRELRVAQAGGMVTLRKGADRITLVIWGNADEATRRLATWLAWGFADAGQGKVVSEAGEEAASAFAARTGLSL